MLPLTQIAKNCCDLVDLLEPYLNTRHEDGTDAPITLILDYLPCPPILSSPPPSPSSFSFTGPRYTTPTTMGKKRKNKKKKGKKSSSNSSASSPLTPTSTHLMHVHETPSPRVVVRVKRTAATKALVKNRELIASGML